MTQPDSLIIRPAEESAAVALPEFGVRRSARARRVRLSVTARDGLVVTLPHGAPASAAVDAVRAKRAWAARALERVAERRAELLAGPDALLPATVTLRAIARSWPVEYRVAGEPGSGTARATVRDGLLVVSGDIDDADACLDALRRWRTREARRVLPRLLRERAERLGLEHGRVSVRLQRSRWGSCSSAGNISLNANLVFLPAELADVILVHELAHLVHCDHSPRFYELLESWRPGAAALRGETKEAWRHVPAWAMA